MSFVFQFQKLNVISFVRDSLNTKFKMEAFHLQLLSSILLKFDIDLFDCFPASHSLIKLW